jgi:hypothetical protein
LSFLSWNKFIFEVELQLTEDNAKRYDRMLTRCENEIDKAYLLLRIVLDQTQNKVVLFFDNLESIQRSDTLELDDCRIKAWISAARKFTTDRFKPKRWDKPANNIYISATLIRPLPI